jgi:hypothetical protein
MLRLPHFLDNRLTDGGEVVSLQIIGLSINNGITVFNVIKLN